MFKYVMALLVILFLLLQYQLWRDHDGVETTVRLHRDLDSLNKQKQTLKRQTDELQQTGVDDNYIKSHARSDLGMVHKGETFYRVVDS